jgi:hypothetical protein
LVFFRKHVVRALELGFYTSRRCTMQLNQTQLSPLTVLLQLNLCYQVQTIVVSPDAHPSIYSSVAPTLYPTLIFVYVYMHKWFVGICGVASSYTALCSYMNLSDEGRRRSKHVEIRYRQIVCLSKTA